MSECYELTIRGLPLDGLGGSGPRAVLDISADGLWKLRLGIQPGELEIVSTSAESVGLSIDTAHRVITAAAFQPAGCGIASGGNDGALSIHTQDGDEILRVHVHEGPILALAWNHSGSELATASQDGAAKVIDAADGKIQAIYRGHQSPVRGIAFAEEGHYLISSGEDHQLHVWRRDRPPADEHPGPRPRDRSQAARMSLRHLALP